MDVFNLVLGFLRYLRCQFWLMMLTLFFMLTNGSCRQEGPFSPELKRILQDSLGDSLIDSDGMRVFMPGRKTVCQYYENANYTFIWCDSTGGLNSNGKNLIERIRTCYLEGLNPESYHLAEIENLVFPASPLKPKRPDCAFLDVLLTDAYRNYAADHYAGRVRTSEEDSDWQGRASEINPLDSLSRLTEGVGIDSLLERFRCPYREYSLLEDALRNLHQDANLNRESTWKDSVLKIVMNMERWRWMPRKPMPSQCIIINGAAFSLKVRRLVSDTLGMKIIVGKTETPTPIFHAPMLYIVLNPWWDVPHSIATTEILPELKKDPSYLEKNHFELYRPTSPHHAISAFRINWKRVTERNFNYKLRQTPGPWNALGKLKFIFPNQYSIYLHDTPGRQLFSENVRTFSHGCIRLEQPVELAAFLLGCDSATIHRWIDTHQEKQIGLPTPIEVFVRYETAWVDEEHRVCFSSDVYGYDARLRQHFEALPDESQVLH